jgi:hypothetical protein
METVRRHGRNYEPELLLRYFLGANPIGLVGQAPLGMTMLRHGRLALTPPRGAGPDAVQSDVEVIFRKSLEVDAAALRRKGREEAQA